MPRGEHSPVSLEPSAGGVNTTTREPDSPAAGLDPEDIARFAVAAFRDSGRRFHGWTVETASEAVTVEEMLRLLSRAAGREMQAIWRKEGNPFVAGQLGAAHLIDQLDSEGVRGCGVPPRARSLVSWRGRTSVLSRRRRVAGSRFDGAGGSAGLRCVPCRVVFPVLRSRAAHFYCQTLRVSRCATCARAWQGSMFQKRSVQAGVAPSI